MTIFGIPIFPEQASTFAKDVDALYFFIFAVSAFFAVVVAIGVIYFGIRYHKTHDSEIGARIEGSLPLELLWSVIPTIIAMVMFGWGASVYYHLRRPPAEAMHIYAVGKQWMWKFQHLEGQREINELHVEAGFKLNGSLVRAGLVDEFVVYLAPKLLGQGAGMFHIGPLSELGQGVELEFKSTDMVGPDLRVVARVQGRDRF